MFDPLTESLGGRGFIVSGDVQEQPGAGDVGFDCKEGDKSCELQVNAPQKAQETRAERRERLKQIERKRTARNAYCSKFQTAAAAKNLISALGIAAFNEFIDRKWESKEIKTDVRATGRTIVRSVAKRSFIIGLLGTTVDAFERGDDGDQGAKVNW